MKFCNFLQKMSFNPLNLQTNNQYIMKEFVRLMQEQFKIMTATGKLFRSSLTGEQVKELYINGFENDPIFRDPNSSVHNCNLCKNFIRRYGNIVAIDENYNTISLFDFETPEEFKSTARGLSIALKAAPIGDVFFETFDELNSLPYESCKKTNPVFRLGIASNHKRYTKEEAEKFGVVKPEEIRTFTHMHLDIPKEYVDMTGKSIDAIMGDFRDAKAVFERGMNDIPEDTLKLVKDLINQGSLLDGQTHLFKIEQILPLKIKYDGLQKSLQSNYCWIASYRLNIAKFRNELIGTLCVELAEGKELNEACQAWNKRVDPANYMKATAPITKKQIEEAQKFVEENGYAESFDRRFATIDDIKVSEILHSNVGDGKLKKVSIFDNVKSTSTRHKRSEFDGIEEVGIEKFMKDILPGCTSVEAFLSNKHDGNMVSFTTANNKDSKPIFKWSNNYSWTFNGNLAGKSQLKEAVKSAGGNVTGVLRFSISWNRDGRDILDFDAHAVEPDRTHIYYGAYKGNKTSMSGMLDVDMIRPSKMGVENIVWSDIKKMRDGEYGFMIRNYDGGDNTGFQAEVEFDGEIFSYEKKGNIKGDTIIATITKKGNEFTIKHHLPESNSSKEIYGLETNQFHKVNLVCLSPNHWEGNNVGNKHYMFMLDGCKCPTEIRSFHNENLIPELLKHRKVTEVLGMKNMIAPSDKQLSGLGFNATVKDEVILKLSGTHKRIIKVKF